MRPRRPYLSARDAEKLAEIHGDDAVAEYLDDGSFLGGDEVFLLRGPREPAPSVPTTSLGHIDDHDDEPPMKTTPRSTRFVSIPADRLLGELRSIGAAVRKAGGSFVEGTQGREVVVDIVPPGGRAMVRVYTSLAAGAAEARDCGEDAVRLVVCVRMPNGVRPLEEPEKILRTAPAGARDRVGAFLGRLRARVRSAYVAAAKRPPCPMCGRAMARRKTRDGAREFYGCIGYPECRGTAPAKGA